MADDLVQEKLDRITKLRDRYRAHCEKAGVRWCYCGECYEGRREITALLRSDAKDKDSIREED